MSTKNKNLDVSCQKGRSVFKRVWILRAEDSASAISEPGVSKEGWMRKYSVVQTTLDIPTDLISHNTSYIDN